MKLSTIIGARNTLSGITAELPFSVAYKIAKFVESTEAAAKLFDDKRQALVEEYVVGEGEARHIPDEKLNEVNEKLADLGNEDIPDIKPVFELKDLDELKFTPAQAYALLELVKATE